MPKLYRVPSATIQPFALMLAPVYLYMNQNEKFISIKAPLDFFTQDELRKMSKHEYFYLPESTKAIMPYRETAHRVRTLLTLNPETLPAVGDDADGVKLENPEVTLPPAPFELSNAILNLIGPLWWEYPANNIGIEPFFVTVFVNELCDLLPEEALLKAREADVENFDRALLRSSLAVFLALHLGYCDLDFLNRLRFRVFQETTGNVTYNGSTPYPTDEIDQVVVFCRETINNAQKKVFLEGGFEDRLERISLKLLARLLRVKREFVSKGEEPPTVYSKGGFFDPQI